MDKIQLFDVINSAFNISELRELCFRLGVDFENVGGTTKGEKVIEIIGYFERRNQLIQLENYCRSERSENFPEDIQHITYTSSVAFPLHSVKEAIAAIERLSIPTTWSLLEITRTLVNGCWMGSDSDMFIDILYSLYAPIVEYKIRQYEVDRNFSLLDWRTRLQFSLLEFAVQAILHNEKIAAINPKIKYTPQVKGWRLKREHNPQQFWWQGLSQERFDKAVNAFCVIENHRRKRILSLPEFRSSYHRLFKSTKSDQKDIGLAANALYGFTPTTRPVYWRILVIQSILYHAIVGPYSDLLKQPDSSAELSALIYSHRHSGFPFEDAEQSIEGFESFADTANAASEFINLIVVPNVLLKLRASQYNEIPDEG